MEEKKGAISEMTELVLDGGFVIPDNQTAAAAAEGFVAPEINSFGQSFRDYAAESERQKSVEEFYRMNHIHQTYNFVKKMREQYGKMDRVEMSIWECCELLNDVVDDSDPDLDEPQIQHLLQTAEAIRKDYPDQDWLHLTALIHGTIHLHKTECPLFSSVFSFLNDFALFSDLGKVLLLPSFGGLPQWAVVGKN